MSTWFLIIIHGKKLCGLLAGCPLTSNPIKSNTVDSVIFKTLYFH